MRARGMSHGIRIDDALMYLAQPAPRPAISHRRSDLGRTQVKGVTLVWKKCENDALSSMHPGAWRSSYRRARRRRSLTFGASGGRPSRAGTYCISKHGLLGFGPRGLASCTRHDVMRARCHRHL